MAEEANELIELTATIVAAYVSNNHLSAGDLPSVVTATYAALAGADKPAAPEPAPRTPAVSIRKSIAGERVICLDCGKSFASIKRHLKAAHDLAPDGYRARWDLPKDYPMVAPGYSAARSVLAKSIGLGQGGRRVSAEPTTVSASTPTIVTAKPQAKVRNKRAPGEAVAPAKRTMKAMPTGFRAAAPATVRPPSAIDPSEEEFT